MAAVHLPQYHTNLTQPIKYKESRLFAKNKGYCCCNICSCAKDKVHARFEDFRAFLNVFMSCVV